METLPPVPQMQPKEQVIQRASLRKDFKEMMREFKRMPSEMVMNLHKNNSISSEKIIKSETLSNSEKQKSSEKELLNSNQESAKKLTLDNLFAVNSNRKIDPRFIQSPKFVEPINKPANIQKNDLHDSIEKNDSLSSIKKNDSQTIIKPVIIKTELKRNNSNYSKSSKSSLKEYIPIEEYNNRIKKIKEKLSEINNEITHLNQTVDKKWKNTDFTIENIPKYTKENYEIF